MIIAIAFSFEAARGEIILFHLCDVIALCVPYLTSISHKSKDRASGKLYKGKAHADFIDDTESLRQTCPVITVEMSISHHNQIVGAHCLSLQSNRNCTLGKDLSLLKWLHEETRIPFFGFDLRTSAGSCFCGKERMTV